MKPPLSKAKKAVRPISLDDAAAELTALLGPDTRELLKHFSRAGRLPFYRISGARMVQRHHLTELHDWVEEKIGADPDWLRRQRQKAGSRARNTGRVVVRGTGNKPVPAVSQNRTASAPVPKREVRKAGES